MANLETFTLFITTDPVAIAPELNQALYLVQPLATEGRPFYDLHKAVTEAERLLQEIGFEKHPVAVIHPGTDKAAPAKAKLYFDQYGRLRTLLL